MAEPNEQTAANLPRRLERWDVLLLALLLVLTFMVGSFAATNSDVWLHLASGRQIAQGEWTIGVDPFSFATEATGARPAIPWVHHSWLYCLLFYWLYNLAGGGGLVVLKALGGVALAWCLLQIPGGKRFRLLSLIYVGFAVLAISPQLILRPMTVSFLFYGITLFICFRAGVLGNVAPRPGLLWWLPPLFLLWANLDAWFIMGPLTLAFLWIGMGLGFLLGIPGTFPGKVLGAVFGVGLLACLVNPHHVQVFQLPPELANLVMRVVDLPDFLGAGGRALRNLQLVDPDFYPQMSPLAPNYWGALFVTGGHYLAGLAYFVLLFLGLVSFVVNAVVTKKPGAPGLHPGRFILWVFLAFCSLIQIRLIPWFAIACAPLTVLNLVDWRTWLTNIQVANWRPAYLGRALVFFVFLVLFFLAWPGWLYSLPGNYAAPRRLAWQMPPDPSHHGAALYLAEWQQKAKSLRVFNFHPEIAHYCAWFAPGVKCFLDARWPLFPDEAAQAVKARLGLATNHPEAWQPLFTERKVDCLALGKLNLQLQGDANLVGTLWMQEGQWYQKYADGKSLLFAWSGPDKTYAGEFRADLNRRAFGKVPENQRAPAQAPVWPQEEPTLWAQYWDGLQPLPLAAHESNYWSLYHQTMARAWPRSNVVVSMVTCWTEPAGMGFLSITLPYTFGTMDTIPATINLIDRNRSRSNKKPILKARDFGPPAALLLRMRLARQALFENPDQPRCYLILRHACNALWNDQEDHWANYGGDNRQSGSMRATMRQIQILTALKTYLDLQPEDFPVHEQMGNMFLQLNFLDLAVQHLQQAARFFDQYPPEVNDPRSRESFNKQKEGMIKKVHDLEEEVKKRQESYALEAASKKGLAKFQLAMGRGLALEALDQLLANVKVEDLNPQEKDARDYMLIRLLLHMGRAPVLSESIAKTGPGFADFRAFHAAALGNYADLDKAFAENEKTMLGNRAQSLTTALVIHGLNQGSLDQLPLFARVLALHMGLSRLHRAIGEVARPAAELLTLRGIMALEYGDTAAARKHLEAALQLAGTEVYFQDRPIAERYLELLRAND